MDKGESFRYLVAKENSCNEVALDIHWPPCNEDSKVACLGTGSMDFS